MKISNFYFYWSCFRWGFVALGTLILIVLAITGNTWSLEFEYIGPGGEFDRLEREFEDKQNERARDRCRCEDACPSPRELERAAQWERDHGA